MPRQPDTSAFVLILACAVIAAFLFLIHTFLIDIFLAAVFAGLLTPLFRRTTRLLGGREGVATALIVTGALLAGALPLAAVTTLAVSEAIQVSTATVAWIERMMAHPQSLLETLPGSLVASREFAAAATWVSAHAADVVGSLSGYLSGILSFVLGGIGRLFLDLFVIAFALAYFLQHGPQLIRRFEELIPVSRAETRTIVDRTLKITAATLRSVVVGGAVDGVLIAIGFAFANIGQPLFWGMVAVVASQTPVLGCAVVWIPAFAYLMLTGHVAAGIGLALWGTLINTVADNLLRATIIGRGAAIPGFLVLVSTLGGIAVFGAAGILIGPVLAGVTIGIIDLYRGAVVPSDTIADRQ